MSWIYKGRPVSDKTVKGYKAFTYMMLMPKMHNETAFRYIGYREIDEKGKWLDYYGSSLVVKNWIAKYGKHLVKREITGLFKSAVDARRAERLLFDEYNALSDMSFFNSDTSNEFRYARFVADDKVVDNVSDNIKDGIESVFASIAKNTGIGYEELTMHCFVCNIAIRELNAALRSLANSGCIKITHLKPEDFAHRKIVTPVQLHNPFTQESDIANKFDLVLFNWVQERRLRTKEWYDAQGVSRNNLDYMYRKGAIRIDEVMDPNVPLVYD